MTLYIILCFVALCAGMALSVYAFGTGGKRKRIFQDIYFSAEETDGVGVLYTKTGEYSAVLKIENPVQKYSADIDSYYDFTHLFTALAQTLGEGYAIHKQDIFVRKQFASEPTDGQEFLSSSYFRYFKGRPYTDSLCYLTITQEAKKSRLFSFDSKKWRDFLVKIRKVHDQLRDGGVQARFLNKAEASEYVDRYFAMNFKDRTVSMTNFKADDETVSMGDKRCKVYSLVDVDCAALPSQIRPYTNIEVNNTEMPVDLVSVVDSIPNAETVVYNQIIFLPNQKRELSLLDKRRTATRAFPIRTTRWRSRTSSVCRKSSPVRASNWYIHTSTWWWPCLPVQTCKSVRTTWKTLSGVWVSISASGHTTNWNCSLVRFRATATRSMRNTTVS